MAEGQLAYLDASALVKLIVPEPETGALAAEVGTWRHLVCSEIGEVEVMRAARRRDAATVDLARRQLSAIHLLPLAAGIRRVACEVGGPQLRSLDAIHLATALSLEDRCGAVFVYDDRLARAAERHGLAVLAPA